MLQTEVIDVLYLYISIFGEVKYMIEPVLQKEFDSEFVQANIRSIAKNINDI